MLYAGGETIDLLTAGALMAMSFISAVCALFYSVVALRRIKQHKVDEYTLCILGVGFVSFGYWIGNGTLAAHGVGYAHSDWGLVNAAQRTTGSPLGFVAMITILTGYMLMLSPLIRRFPGVGHRWGEVSVLLIIGMWSIGVVMSHSGHMQVRWAADKVDGFSVAITPEFWRNSNIKRMADSDLE